MAKNYGFNPTLEKADQDGSEWQFGAVEAESIVTVPYKERVTYLPKGEVQRGSEDMMDCATRGPLNKLEMDFSYGVKNKIFSPENIEWLRQKGYADDQGNVTFSDAFNAIKSGTTPNGNSLKAPLQSIHNDGLIPKKLLPLEKNMTWNEYHDPKRITSSIEKLAKEFTKRFTINYEQVKNLKKANKEILVVAGHAWPTPVKGVYPKTSEKINHVFLRVCPEYYIFDNYVDSFDGDYIKRLAANFTFYKYAYRIFISAENPDPVETVWIVDLGKRLNKFCSNICSSVYGAVEPEPLEVKTIIYTTAKSFWFKKYYSAVYKVIKKVDSTIIRNFEQEYIDPKSLSPVMVTDSDGDIKLDHEWFYKTFTVPAVAKGYNNICFHLTNKERKDWGLDASVNGVYWNDTNSYFEFYMIADKGERSPRNRTDLPQWIRLFLHECGHAFIHFAGIKQDLINKLNLSQQKNENDKDPVHYFDYKLQDVEGVYELISFMKWSVQVLIVRVIKQIISILTNNTKKVEIKQTVPKITVSVTSEKPQQSKAEKLLNIAYEELGHDVTPYDRIPDEVACAESVCTLVRKVMPEFPLLTYTPTLKKELNNNRNFKQTLDIKPGSIIISPTHSGNGRLSNGHVGIILEDEKIASNSSKNGLWEANYTIDTWIDRYRVYGGMPIYIYEIL